MHRFFLPADHFSTGQVQFTPEISHQLLHVLRLRPGDRVVALDNHGGEFQVELARLEGTEALGRIIARTAVPAEAVDLALFLCLSSREKFEWMLQKCTEAGASSFTPVVSSRTLAQDQSGADRKQGRWARIVQEAAEQSGRAYLPRLFPTVSFESMCGLAGADGRLALIAWEEARFSPATHSLRQRLVGLKRGMVPTGPAYRVAMVIGPEGGFSGDEVELAQQQRMIPVSLGPYVLRMETAAIVATALVLYELGEN